MLPPVSGHATVLFDILKEAGQPERCLTGMECNRFVGEGNKTQLLTILQ